MHLLYIGEFSQAQQIAYKARHAAKRSASELQIGHLTNPDSVHSQFDILAKLTARRYLEATNAAEDGLRNLDQEQPHHTRFRARLQIYQATALWELGDVNEAVTVARDSLLNPRLIGSVLNTTRIELNFRQLLLLDR